MRVGKYYEVEIRMMVGEVETRKLFNHFSLRFNPSAFTLYVRPAIPASFLPAQLKLANDDFSEELFVSSGGLSVNIKYIGDSFISLGTYELQETIVQTLLNRLEPVMPYLRAVDLNMDITTFALISRPLFARGR